MSDGQGLELSGRLFEIRGRPILEELDLLDDCAVCCIGSTSQNARMDDEYSRDHMWGPHLNFVLRDGKHASHGKSLMEAVASMPDEVDGVSWIGYDGPEPRRSGVWEETPFLRLVTGLNKPIDSEADWMKIVGRNGFLGRQWTERLFDATQGEVFHGDWFESTWRDWTKYVPESVQIALASRSSFRIWNAGPEYNLARLIDRNDIVGARLSVFRMVDDVMDLGFTLSGKYVPSFKWRWRHFAGLSVFTSDLVRRVEALTSVGDAVDMLRLARDIELEIKSVLMDRFQPNCPSDAELSRYAHEIRSKITSSNVRDWADLDWSVDLGI